MSLHNTHTITGDISLFNFEICKYIHNNYTIWNNQDIEQYKLSISTIMKIWSIPNLSSYIHNNYTTWINQDIEQ